MNWNELVVESTSPPNHEHTSELTPFAVNEPINILLIEDNPGDARLIRESLSKTTHATYNLEWVDTLHSAKEVLERREVGVVILDLWLPDSVGLDGLDGIRSAEPDLPVVLLTGHDDHDTALEALRRGAQDYLVKGNVNGEAISRVLLYAIGRKRAERDMRKGREVLFQAQKMEALGRLAGGVAHDFNNMLTAILGFGSLALSHLNDLDPARPDVEEMVTAARRASELCHQLLAFGRTRRNCSERLDLNYVIHDLLKLVSSVMGSQIDVAAELAGESRPILADQGHLERIVVNLALNARDAMPDGGRLLIRTESVLLRDSLALRTGTIPPGEYIRLTVRDTGCGMTSEVVDRIFDPFFSTKEFGQGTGLGLSVVYQMVSECRGYLHVESELGRGTEFVIFFPRANAPAKPPVLKVETDVEPSATATVLIVEDEPALLCLVQRQLESIGCRTLSACNGIDALEKARSHPGPIELVLTDVIMPECDGPALVRRLRKQRQDFTALFMTGYDDNKLAECGIDERDRVIHKPFMRNDLIEAVCGCLRRTNAAPAARANA
jgi:signal transduction histidine kinase